MLRVSCIEPCVAHQCIFNQCVHILFTFLCRYYLRTTLHVFIKDQTLPVTMQLSMTLTSYVQIITQYGHRCFRSSRSDQKL